MLGVVGWDPAGAKGRASRPKQVWWCSSYRHICYSERHQTDEYKIMVVHSQMGLWQGLLSLTPRLALGCDGWRDPQPLLWQTLGCGKVVPNWPTWLERTGQLDGGQDSVATLITVCLPVGSCCDIPLCGSPRTPRTPRPPFSSAHSLCPTLL